MQQSPGSQHGWWLLQGPCRSCITLEKGERYSYDTWQSFLGAQCFWLPPCILKNSLRKIALALQRDFGQVPFLFPLALYLVTLETVLHQDSVFFFF